MWLNAVAQWRSKRVACALVTIIESAGSTPRKAGSKMAVSACGKTAGSVGGGAVELKCIELAKEAIARGACITGRFVSNDQGNDWTLAEQDRLLGLCGGTLTVFVEPLTPEPELVIFGGGHIGMHLGRLCEVLEMPYRVYDERKDFVDEKRFSGAKALVCAPFAEISAHVELSDRSYCVVMTYGHEHDEEVLEQLLKNSAIPYIGMIGSPNKAGVLVRNIRQRGGVIDDRLYCPIGLCIGRNLPQEIALSVMAEVVLLARGGRYDHMRIDWTGKT
ncbi:MAG: XdhC family protein [Desulfomonilia bacterium]|jgi:xanthine dehydrogenase accessory factor|uniref:XdhC and CoxI family protein n=1 Tax=anaerobic digester metagenome TaxID=1263854 RepID=A0A485M799_9ZZZZ|nr:XdhC/CoxI family protein [Pseudomonadota bacterium]HRR22263.1 XdhC/CoxI family protein [Desulfomonilia bacterium]HRR70193.1 XdhC/CoxI family protein [Desulfomonilia bacterium]HRT45979.1 XdhC/CoxI family protein [Desulfomonilia bacterium]